MGVQKKEKPSNVKPSRYPHYQEILQERQEDIKQYYQRNITRKTRRYKTILSKKKMEYSTISMEYGIKKFLFKKILPRTKKYKKFENI